MTMLDIENYFESGDAEREAKENKMIMQDFGKGGGKNGDLYEWYYPPKELPRDAGSHDQTFEVPTSWTKPDVSTEGTLLGKNTATPTKYSPEILVKVPRAHARALHEIDPATFTSGNDLWRCYEVSTQLTNGMPVYTILTIAYPATSKYLVESKSLKLYLNSFNLECMGDDKQRAIAALRVKVAEDLIKLLETQVEVTEGYSYSFQKFEDYTSLEEIVDYSKIKAEKVVSSGILQRSNLRIAKRTKVRFDGFRSNCKITNAPDYATVFIKVIGNEGVDAESLVKYLTAYRADQHLHEECAELIFSDLKNVFNPKELLVSCCYTRRGGIDITPTRYYREYVSEYMRSMQWPPHVEPEYYPERTVYQ